MIAIPVENGGDFFSKRTQKKNKHRFTGWQARCKNKMAVFIVRIPDTRKIGKMHALGKNNLNGFFDTSHRAGEKLVPVFTGGRRDPPREKKTFF